MDIKIGPPCQELRGVSKFPRTLRHPVVYDLYNIYFHIKTILILAALLSEDEEEECKTYTL